MNDKDIVQGIQKNNQRALEMAFDLYGCYVFKIIYSILSDGNERNYVEDCVNDVFLSLWNNIDCFDNKRSTLKTWLVAIAKYKSIDYKRKLSKEKIYDCIENSTVSSNLSIEDTIVNLENKKEVLKIINDLKDSDREIFIRKFLLDESVESIAKRLSITQDVVYSRLSRGRKNIKEKFKLMKEVS